jgi:hypothetical protein
MIIVLDTNVIQEDFLMRSSRFAILFDYASKTQSSFAIPRIVHDELAANYERVLAERFGKLIRAREQLNGIRLTPKGEREELDLATAVREYMQHVRQRLNVTESEIHEYGDHYLRDAVERAIRRRKPCTDRGEEIRDALLWQSVLDIAAKTTAPVLLISRNTSHFADAGNTLHPELLAEAQSAGRKIGYLPSLEEFAKQHATPIAFITPSWLQERISSDAILERAERAMRGVVERHNWARGAEVVHMASDWTVTHGELEVSELFVYVMSDGTFRVESTWGGSIEIEREIEVEEELEEVEWAWQYDSASDEMEYRPVPRTRFRTRTRARAAAFNVVAVVDSVVENGAVATWDVVDSWAEST